MPPPPAAGDATAAPGAVSWQRGVAYMLLATACFSMLDMSAKLMVRDLSVVQAVWAAMPSTRRVSMP